MNSSLGDTRAMPDLTLVKTCIAAAVFLAASAATPLEGGAQQESSASLGSYTLPVVFAGGVRLGFGDGRSIPGRPSEGEYGLWIDLRLGSHMLKPWLEFTRSEWGGFTGGFREQPASGSATGYALGIAVSPPQRVLKFIQMEAGAGLGYLDVHRATDPSTDSFMMLFRSAASVPLTRVIGVDAGVQLRHDSVVESSWMWLYSAGLRLCLPRGNCRSN